MNSLRLYVLISCLIVVSVQQSRTAIRPKRRQPPMKSSHPEYWGGRREFYLQSKNVWYIQIEQDGKVSSSKSQTEAAVLQTYSGSDQTVALKGKQAGKFLCMDSSAQIYANESPDEDDCFFFEKFHPNSYNTYHHSFHRRGDMKNYLAIDDDGTIRVGNSTNEVQVYFLPSAVSNSTPIVRTPVTTTTTSMTVTTVKPPLSTSTVAPIKRKLEKTRKRRRRWCKLLIKGRLERKPHKYINRCKHDCNILKTMLDNPKRYKRKCEKQRQRRRRRNRKMRGPRTRTKNRKRHHHGESSKSRTNSRGRGRKRTPNTQTHNIDVT